MSKGSAVKLGIGLVFGVIVVLIFGGRNSARRKSEGVESRVSDESQSEGKTPSAGGTLLGGAAPAGGPPPGVVPTVSTVMYASNAEMLRERLNKTELNPRLESALRAGNDPLVKDLLLYLRARKAKAAFSQAELDTLTGPTLMELQQKPGEVLPLIGRALSALDGGGVENRRDQMDLLELVGAFPHAENPEINRHALSTLSGLYANGGGAKGEEGFESTVATVQAYLATTRASPEAANAALTRAMGGKVDPSVKEVYRNLFNDRYPTRR